MQEAGQPGQPGQPGQCGSDHGAMIPMIPMIPKAVDEKFFTKSSLSFPALVPWAFRRIARTSS